MLRVTPEGAPEADVKKATTDLLDLYNIFWMRNQSSVQVLEYNGKTRVLRAGIPGVADLLALPKIPYIYGPLDHFVPVWIETKRQKGGRQSDKQKEFQVSVEKRGHIYLLVNDVCVLTDWMMGKGII